MGLKDNSPGTDIVIRTFSPLVASASLPILAGKQTCPSHGQYSFKFPEKNIIPGDIVQTPGLKTRVKRLEGYEWPKPGGKFSDLG